MEYWNIGILGLNPLLRYSTTPVLLANTRPIDSGEACAPFLPVYLYVEGAYPWN
jgi:hypothetical protein